MYAFPSDYEVDCPWFDADWLADHADFPLAVAVSDSNLSGEDAGRRNARRGEGATAAS